MIKTVAVKIVMLFFISTAFAQQKKENVFLHPHKFYKKYFPNLKITYNPSDSNYIKTYPKSYMTVAMHLLAPKIYTNLNPTGVQQASSNFRTNINTITGFSFSYRHVTAGFALSLLPPLGDYPNFEHTRYRTATVKYKSPVYILTFKFMKVKGVTDINAFNSLDIQKNTIPRSDITIKEYQFEGIYNFTWKKYSYLATLDYTESQIKSHHGCMIKAGVYNQQLYSDTNLLSIPQRPYFDDFTSITKMIGYTFKVSPGLGGTIVIKKHFYAACSVFSPLNIYMNRLYTAHGSEVHSDIRLQWVLDGSISVGYSTNHFYTALRCEFDGRTTTLNAFVYTSVYNYIGLDIGFRFVAPRLIKKFYKDTMPPGM